VRLENKKFHFKCAKFPKNILSVWCGTFLFFLFEATSNLLNCHATQILFIKNNTSLDYLLTYLLTYILTYLLISLCIEFYGTVSY